MGIYDKLVNFFDRQPAPVSEPEPEQKTEEKAIDFSTVLPGVSDGQMYYFNLDQGNAYSTNSVVHKCVNMLAYNLSKVPLRFSKNGQPLPPETTLKGFDILQPHPRLSLSKLIYECAVYYWYKGEFMALIDEEAPFSLEPIDPGLMTIADAEGRIINSWKFDYRDTILDEELIYISMMNPETVTSTKVSDFDRTLSLVKVVKKEIANYANGREFNTQFFGNFAQLGLTLKDVNGNTSKEDRQDIANQMDNKLSRGRAHKTKVLPQGLDIADTKNLSMKEMEFSQSLKDIRNIILGVFGVPRCVFGKPQTGLAQSTIDTEKRLMWTDTIQPAGYMIQEAFNQTLMKRHFPGYKVFFDYSDIDVLQDNMLDKTALADKLQVLGRTSMEINDQLNMGWEESTDARMNERFMPSGLVPYSEVELSIEEPTKSVDNKVDKEVKRRRNYAYRNKYNRIQRRIEKKMTGKLGSYFAKQLGKVLAVIKSEKDASNISTTVLLSDVMNLLNKEKEVLAASMAALYVEGSLKGSTLAISVLGTGAEPVANELIVSQMTNKIGGINNHTYRLIRTQVKDAVNLGESIADISKRIATVYKFNKSRARTIARTESGAVMNRTTDAEYKKEGIEKKQWIGGERPSHAAIDGQVRPYDEPFDNGLMHPHDPAGPPGEVVNCKCCLGPVMEE